MSRLDVRRDNHAVILQNSGAHLFLLLHISAVPTVAANVRYRGQSRRVADMRLRPSLTDLQQLRRGYGL